MSWTRAIPIFQVRGQPEMRTISLQIGDGPSLIVIEQGPSRAWDLGLQAPEDALLSHRHGNSLDSLRRNLSLPLDNWAGSTFPMLLKVRSPGLDRWCAWGDGRFRSSNLMRTRRKPLKDEPSHMYICLGLGDNYG